MTFEKNARYDAVENAKALLDGIQHQLPVRVDYVTNANQFPSIAVIRNGHGYTFIDPHPESQSALMGERAVIDFIAQSPRVVQELLGVIEGLRAGSKSAKEG